MGRPLEIQLDIETDWHRTPTVLGFYSAETGLVQLVGKDTSAKRLLRELPKSGRLFTYNGDAFDLSCIRAKLGVDLKDRFESVDLRWICQRNGYTGGQKQVERRFGFRRVGEELNGLDAIALWRRYRAGNRDALGRLLEYNAADVRSLAVIKSGLRRSGLLFAVALFSLYQLAASDTTTVPRKQTLDALFSVVLTILGLRGLSVVVVGALGASDARKIADALVADQLPTGTQLDELTEAYDFERTRAPSAPTWVYRLFRRRLAEDWAHRRRALSGSAEA